MTEEEVQLARHAFHYWLDLENGKLYRKVINSDNSQIVVLVEKQLRLLRACHNEVGHK